MAFVVTAQHVHLETEDMDYVQRHRLRLIFCLLQGDQVLKNSDKQTVDHQGGLTIHSVSRASDAGVYTCTARDRQGHTARRDVTLDVVGKWRHLRSKQSLRLMTHELIRPSHVTSPSITRVRSPDQSSPLQWTHNWGCTFQLLQFSSSGCDVGSRDQPDANYRTNHHKITA